MAREPVTGKRLAQVLAEEFASGAWGDVDPGWFSAIATDEVDDHPNADEVRSLQSLLARAAKRLR